MWKHLVSSALIITITTAALTVSTYSAFTTSATVSGIQFSTGMAELKLFGNLGYTNAGNNGNLTPTLPGLTFEGIGPDWTEDYWLKYFNTGTVAVLTNLTAEVDEDPNSLRDHIQVEVWDWDDVNGNGEEDAGDIFTQIAPAQTIAALISTPVDLGQLEVSTPRGLRLRFSTGDVPSNLQNKTASFDFIINGTTEGVTIEPEAD